MSLMSYDKGILQKVKNLYPETVFGSPEECFKINARKHNGKVLMPFIAVWRMPDFTVDKTTYNDSFVRRGIRNRTSATNGVEFPNQDVAMHGLPVTLTYQVDIYAQRREICDGLTAELLIEMYENPYVDVHIEEMGDDFVQQFHVDTEDTVNDNTSISDFEETNRFYRLSLTLILTNAIIYRISQAVKKIETVSIDMEDLGVEDSEEWETFTVTAESEGSMDTKE